MDIADEYGINGLFYKLNQTFKNIQIGIDDGLIGVIKEDFSSYTTKDSTSYFIQYVHKGLVESKYVEFKFKLKDLKGYGGNENQFTLRFKDNIEVTLNNGIIPVHININAEKK